MGQNRSDPPRPNTDQRFQDITRAAVEVFSEMGYVAGTTAEISRRVSLTQPAIYHYVDSKHALLVLICNRVGTLLSELLDEARQIEAPPCAMLRNFIIAYLTTISNESAYFAVYVAEARHLPDKVQRNIRRAERRFVQDVAKLIADAQQHGFINNDVQPWIGAQLILGMMNWTYRWFKHQVTLDQLADSVLLLLIGTSVSNRDEIPGTGIHCCVPG